MRVEIAAAAFALALTLTLTLTLTAMPATGQCPGSGSCCEPNGTVGCTDTACCNLICSADVFCCETQWDQVCAEAACAQCAGCDCFPDCSLGCEAGDIAEAEGCGADTNGGCNGTPPTFASVSHGQSICGTAWSSDGVRDTDWYLLSAGYVATRITAAGNSEFAGGFFILDGIAGCAPVVIGVPGDAAGCVSGVPASAVVPPGDYVVFAATLSFAGVPCGTSNVYRVEVTAKCDGDTNADDQVNVTDLVNVVLSWGTSGLDGAVDADLDDNGVVNVVDLVIVIRRWGSCLP